MLIDNELECEELLANMDLNDEIDIVPSTENEINPKIEVKYTEFKSSFAEYSSKVNWTIFFTICLFTLGAWLDISAIWSELVYLVDELPEGWRLPSILNLISVTAQLGPLTFSLGRYLFPKKFTFVRAIYFIFVLGLASCLFLALFWKKTQVIFNEERSIYLYIFNFTLSFLDGMSSVTFLPYIGGYFTKEYIIPNYIGESLSSLLPGLLAILQSIGVDDECSLLVNNASNISIPISNTSLLEIEKPSRVSHRLTPNYSVSLYFIFILILLFGSTSAFTFLNFSKTAKRIRKSNKPKVEEINMSQMELVTNISSEKEENTFIKENKKHTLTILLIIAFLCSFIQYGYLPGLLSYSTIPYGNIYFHLSINISSVCLPIAIFFSIWSYKVTLKRILLEFNIAAIFAIYIVIVSFKSPCPPFVDSFIGGYLIVLSWVVCSCMFLRIRCLIAATLEVYGQNILLIFGLATIFGQMIGGIIIFVNVDIYHIFKETKKCSNISICTK